MNPWFHTMAPPVHSSGTSLSPIAIQMRPALSTNSQRLAWTDPRLPSLASFSASSRRAPRSSPSILVLGLLHRVHLTDPTGNGVGSLAAVGDVVYFTLGPSVHTFNVTSGGVATVFTGDDNIAFMRVDRDGALLVAFEASPMHLLMPQKLA